MAEAVQLSFADFKEAEHARRECELLPRLHAAEQARYHGFRHLRRRRIWLAGRELLLAALACQLSYVEVAALRTDASGAVRYGRGNLHLSLSHSGEVLAAALADVPIGVDVERPRPRACIAQAGRLFAPAEARYLRALVPAARPAKFYSLWTLKEAFAKAAGISIWDALRNAEFDLQAQRLRLSVPLAKHAWNCVHAEIMQACQVALVAQSRGRPLKLECWRRMTAGEWTLESLIAPAALCNAAAGLPSTSVSMDDLYAEPRLA